MDGDLGGVKDDLVNIIRLAAFRRIARSPENFSSLANPGGKQGFAYVIPSMRMAVERRQFLRGAGLIITSLHCNLHSVERTLHLPFFYNLTLTVIKSIWSTSLSPSSLITAPAIAAPNGCEANSDLVDRSLRRHSNPCMIEGPVDGSSPTRVE
jgi:hypothetical protein